MIKQLLRFWELSVKLWVNLAVAVKNRLILSTVGNYITPWKQGIKGIQQEVPHVSNLIAGHKSCFWFEPPMSCFMIFTSKTQWNMGNMGPVWLDDWPVEHAGFPKPRHVGHYRVISRHYECIPPAENEELLKNYFQVESQELRLVEAREVESVFYIFLWDEKMRKSNMSGKTVISLVLDCDK